MSSGMSTPTPIREAASLAVRASPTTALALALLASIGTGAAWFGLATATGLIFHFLPGATFLAAGWTFRRRSGGAATSWTLLGMILVGATIASAVTLAGLIATGQPLDEPLLTAAVVVAGAAIAVAWLRRPPTANPQS